METTLKSSLIFLSLFLLVSFFISLLPEVSEARPLQGKEGVKGVFRTLKGDGPSPGVGHRLIRGMKDSGPNLGGVEHIKLQNHGSHKLNIAHIIGGIKDSGPSPGEGH
ncbi:unnamed protein product [Lathyrus sativus]|nr:unnamed protein product [Lathyrus sativus]